MPFESPTSNPARRDAAARVVRAACGAATVAGLWLLASHAARYFFLFDDFPLNGQASRWPIGEILGTPLFGFYRPGFFLWLRGAHVLFGWHTPQGYAALALGLHAVNAALVGRLAREVVGTGAGARIAATLFFLAPWSAEAVFWVSGGFDLLATCGALTAVLTALSFCALNRSRAASATSMAGCLAGTVVALFTKESTVVLGALVLTFLAARAAGPAPDVSRRRVAAVTAVMLALSAGYLAIRSVVVASPTGGAYGSWFALVSDADVLANLRSFGHAALVWPAPHDAQMHPVGLLAWLRPLASTALAALTLVAVIRRPRAALPLAGAALICVLPVVWLGLHAGTSAAGRVIYLAGVPFVLLCGLGLQRLLALETGWSRWTSVVTATVILTAAVTSLEGQRIIWAQAGRLSRASVEAFRPFIGQTAPIHIDNLPFWFAEGPYVIKSYAFAYYYFPATVPPTTGTALELVSIDGRVTVTTRQPEPGAGKPPPGALPAALDIELR